MGDICSVYCDVQLPVECVGLLTATINVRAYSLSHADAPSGLWFLLVGLSHCQCGERGEGDNA